MTPIPVLQRRRSLVALAICAIAMGGGAAWLTSQVNPVFVIGGLALLLGAAVVFAQVEWGLLGLVLVMYTNLPDVVVNVHQGPSIGKAIVPLLVTLILARWHVFGEEPQGWKRIGAVLGFFLVAALASLLPSTNVARTIAAIADVAKDLVIAALIPILFRSRYTFRNVVWTLLTIGIFLGTISAYQFVTGSFDNPIWGFGQADVRQIVGRTQDYRMAGPIGDANFYAQIMLVLVPLALDRLWQERHLVLRLFAGYALCVTAMAVVFTYSRGGFLALIIVFALMLVLNPPRPLPALLTVAAAVLIVLLLPTRYLERLQTLQTFLPAADQSVQDDEALRNRSSENTVALLIFTDHPLLGVGYDMYPSIYQQYSRELGLDDRREERAAHSLYLELAAELGLFGILAFGVVLTAAFHALNRAQALFRTAKLLDTSHMVRAYAVGLIGYLVAALFLHDAYQRYFWLLIGIAFAVWEIAERDLKPRITRARKAAR